MIKSLHQVEFVELVARLHREASERCQSQHELHYIGVECQIFAKERMKLLIFGLVWEAEISVCCDRLFNSFILRHYAFPLVTSSHSR